LPVSISAADGQFLVHLENKFFNADGAIKVKQIYKQRPIINSVARQKLKSPLRGRFKGFGGNSKSPDAFRHFGAQNGIGLLHSAMFLVIFLKYYRKCTKIRSSFVQVYKFSKNMKKMCFRG